MVKNILVQHISHPISSSITVKQFSNNAFNQLELPQNRLKSSAGEGNVLHRAKR